MASESEQSGDDVLKEAVLKAALKDAAFDGFTDSVLAKAGKETGMDQAALARLFPDGPLSLIEYFSSSIDEAMEKKLAATELSTRKIRERIKIAVMTRLWLLEPHKEAARRAAATLSLPMHAALGAKLLYRTVDAMWRVAGDTSTDFNFYTKRGILAGVYGSVLVRWFSDTGEDDSATEAFLDARIENVMQFEKFKAKAKQALANFPAFAAWTKPKAN
ncbi:MAG TPA: COQ9 family protein [Rhizomicrobium sp.]|nr:COQ9 family protein [Rhizomicrobium sp.]